MQTELFNFELPEELIALTPAQPRDGARMLVIDPSVPPPGADRIVADLPDLLNPGDALVLNDTRVIAAALHGVRTRNGIEASIALTLTRRLDEQCWRALAKPAKRLETGDRLQFGERSDVCLMGTLEATVAAVLGEGEVEIAFDFAGPALDFSIATVGEVPLPPYIAQRRPTEPRDAQDYQTVYARNDGAVAAPTAGLHITQQLLDRLVARGVSLHYATLHVGPGTFLPVKAEDTRDHRMHAEWCRISAETAADLNAVRAAGRRIVAVGTTSARMLETAADESGMIRPYEGNTSIFITPGYRFKAVDRLLTNFHLPRSTLFMLVAAFAGLDTMKAAYAHAIASRYRFYSYGDACLLTRRPQ